MLKFTGQLILSFIVTNWIYSEICLFYPPAATLAARVAEVIKFPTHDEWPEIANSPDARKLQQDVGQLVSRSPTLSSYVADPAVRRRWNAGPGSLFAYLLGTRSIHASSQMQCSERADNRNPHKAPRFFICPGLYQNFNGELHYRISSQIERF